MPDRTYDGGYPHQTNTYASLTRPRGGHDLIIAATALATGRAVVTTDARGFADLPGVQVRLVA